MIEKTSREEMLRILIELSSENNVYDKLDGEYSDYRLGSEREFIQEFHQALHCLINHALYDPAIIKMKARPRWLQNYLQAKEWLSAKLKNDPVLKELYGLGEAYESTQEALARLFSLLIKRRSLSLVRKDPAMLLPASERERKVRKKIPTKVRMALQQETQSRCPFCADEEVQFHEVHHIDEDRANGDIFNLILICRNCHGKITAGTIARKEVIEVKKNVTLASSGIELATVQIDPECAWAISDENHLAFFHEHESTKHQNPVFNLTIINHQKRTIVLHELELRANYLFSGLSGPPPEPRILHPLARYKIHLPSSRSKSSLKIKEQIEIRSEVAAQFQIEVAGYREDDGRTHEVSGRTVLRFVLGFSGNQKVKLPPLFLNTIDENPGITVVYAD